MQLLNRGPMIFEKMEWLKFDQHAGIILDGILGSFQNVIDLWGNSTEGDKGQGLVFSYRPFRSIEYIQNYSLVAQQ